MLMGFEVSQPAKTSGRIRTGAKYLIADFSNWEYAVPDISDLRNECNFSYLAQISEN